MSSLAIGQLAKLAEVGIETIRFYERQGLIDEPPRRPSGYREYPPEVVERVRFIKAAKELGFSLREIAELLSLRVNPEASCGDVKACAEAKLRDVRDKLRVLRKMERALSNLVAACEANRPTKECPILDALDRQRRAPFTPAQTSRGPHGGEL